MSPLYSTQGFCQDCFFKISAISADLVENFRGTDWGRGHSSNSRREPISPSACFKAAAAPAVKVEGFPSPTPTSVTSIQARSFQSLLGQPGQNFFQCAARFCGPANDH